MTTTSKRVVSVDLLRGCVMILMALDHTRDFFSNLRIRPEDLSRSTPLLFLTRWVTHFCAPSFFFLAGVGASLMLSAGKSKKQVSWFLFTRGLWLAFLELTILHFFWNFKFSNPHFLLVLWALGMSMVILSAAIFLPRAVVAAIGLVMIAGHNLLDGVTPESLGAFAPFWHVLHVPGFAVTPTLLVAYPLIPWCGVMMTGFALGAVFDWEPERRKRFLLRAGVAATIGFVALRFLNGYGDPGHWSAQTNPLMTVASFFNLNKYPPSLLFLLMTLGPALIALRVFENARGKVVDFISVYGKVPMFYYVVHILVIHLLASAFALAQGGEAGFLGLDIGSFPKWYGTNLAGVYVAWIAVVLILYIPCRWFSNLKARRRDWWLGYL
ncbi:MAG: heparan-alpha-glucosaminide N-acetyltransferase domain-containing protein [Gemmatimonadales bacterium]